MGWTNEQANELVAPADTPFLPGNDVIGFGTQLPPELASYHPFGVGTPAVQAAVVFYNSSYNPALTTPQIKFHWIGPGSDPDQNICALCIGFAVVNNAAVSQIGIVTAGVLIGGGAEFPGHFTNVYGFSNHLDVDVCEVSEWDTGGDGVVGTFSANGSTDTGSLPSGH